MTVQKLFIIIAILALAISLFRQFKKTGDGILINIIQYFVGFLFIFSGVVKAIDPLGTSFKMHEYFESFAKDGLPSLWEKLSSFSLPISILMIVAEIVLGFALIIGWRSRWVTIGLLAINLFFLYLTGYSYLSGFCLTKQVMIMAAFLLLLLFLVAFLKDNKKRFLGIVTLTVLIGLYFIYCKTQGACNTCTFTAAKMKVTDCGCFGDFMKLKPWETFYKDIFLTILSLFLVRYHERISTTFKQSISWISVAAVLAISLFFCLYNVYLNEPIVDFRPYAIGNDINEKMKEIEPSITENILIYKNSQTGEDKRFGITNLPTDTIWTFKDRLDSVIKEGIPAPIHNLRLSDADGNDVTPSLLSEEAISFWIVCYNANIANQSAFDESIIPFAKEMRAQGINVYCLVGNSNANFDKKASQYMDLVRADETALKTMIRSNPGIMKIQSGKILDKWHFRQFSSKNVGL